MPNESLIHADVFFFVSTIALVVIATGLAIFLYYGIKIARNVRDISDRLKIESSELVADLKKLRLALRDEGVKWKHVVDLVRGFFIRKGEKATKKAAKQQ